MHPGYRIATLLITLPFLAVIAGQSIATEYATIMPLASRSLLLDIAGAGDRAVVAGDVQQ